MNKTYRMKSIGHQISAYGFAAGLALLILIFTGCSTTRKLTEGETLYTGVKEMKIVPTDN